MVTANSFKTFVLNQVTRFSVVTGLFLFGCEPYGKVLQDNHKINSSLPWAVSCDFPENMVNHVRDGFNYWNDAAGKTLFHETPCIAKGSGIVGVLVRSGTGSEGDVIGHANEAYTTSGGIVGGTIVLTRLWFTDNLDFQRTATMRHEIGHVLGFEHTNAFSCLMYPEASVNELCPAELDKLKELY